MGDVVTVGLNGESLDREIIAYMQEHESEFISMPVLSLRLPCPESKLHGRQHNVSRAIVRLRQRGLLEDVADRCPMCGRAGRPQEEVRLFLTDLGKQFNPHKDDMPAFPLGDQLLATERYIRRLRSQIEQAQRLQE